MCTNLCRPDIWFDDVDEDLLELSDAEHAGKEKCREDEKPIDMSNPLVKETTVEGYVLLQKLLSSTLFSVVCMVSSRKEDRNENKSVHPSNH